MGMRWRGVIGAVLLAAGAWIVLFLESPTGLLFAAACVISVFGLTLLLHSLGARLPRRRRPVSLDRQEELKEIFRGYPR